MIREAGRPFPRTGANRVSNRRSDGRTSLIYDTPDGRKPALTSEGEARRKQRNESVRTDGPYYGPEDLDFYTRCIIRSPLPRLSSGYDNNFEGGWKILNPDEAFVGRALTAAYLPSRPDLQEHITRAGQSEGRIGRPNSWPIDMLQKGDVYVADGFGKVIDGTLIGDNLGNAIFAKTGTGVVFYAAARDLEGLRRIKGFNALVREWDHSS